MLKTRKAWAEIFFTFCATLTIAATTVGDLRGASPSTTKADDTLPWAEAVAAVKNHAADVVARRHAADALEACAQEEGEAEAEDRSPAELRALRDDLAALAAVAARAGDDLRVRMTLVRVLASEPFKPLTAPTVPTLLGVIADESDDPALRGAIIAMLAPIDPTEACRDAVLAAARSPAEVVRATALYTLERMKIDPDRCLSVADAGLDDPAGPVRLAALDLVGDLAERRTHRALAILLRAFHHNDRELRLLALLRLRGLGPDAAPAIGDLIAALDDPDPGIRLKVATVLADLTGNPGAYVSYLVDGLRSKNLHVWRAAASDLMFRWRAGSAPDPRVPALAAALGDSDPDIQGRAAIVLAHVTGHAERYVRAIEHALNSTDPATRSWAALWGKTVLREPLRVAHVPTPTVPRPRRLWPVALGLGLVTVLGLGILAWFEARARR